MKSVLMSIKPKYCELIANGKKTVEVRKNRPKLDIPFKCYIYCTKPSKKHQTICGCMVLNDDELYRHPKQGIKYGDSIALMCCNSGEYSKDNFLNGKVIGEFVCDKTKSIHTYSDLKFSKDCTLISYVEAILKYGCLSLDELIAYANDKKYIYGWHISDLKIYDEPKELSEFKKINRECWYADLGLAKRDCPECKNADCFLTRPPQSWCYVEELRE